MPIGEQEEAFVKRFIVEGRQERYLYLLSKSKTRRKFLGELYHRLAIRGSLATELSSKNTTVEYIETQLQQRGAGPEAYIISPNRQIDQQWFPLRSILEEILPQDREAVVCCLPGELAFYLAEDSAYILHYPLKSSQPFQPHQIKEIDRPPSPSFSQDE